MIPRPCCRIVFVRFAFLVCWGLAGTFLSAAPQDDKTQPPLNRLDKKQNFETYLQSSAGSTANASNVLMGGVKYRVINLEFNDEDDCKYFEIEGIRVLKRYKRFAQVIYRQQDEKTTLEELNKRAVL